MTVVTEAKLRPLWRCEKCGHRFVTKNLWHSCGRYRLADHFKGRPRVLRRTFDRFAGLARDCGPVTGLRPEDADGDSGAGAVCRRGGAERMVGRRTVAQAARGAPLPDPRRVVRAFGIWAPLPSAAPGRRRWRAESPRSGGICYRSAVESRLNTPFRRR